MKKLLWIIYGIISVLILSMLVTGCELLDRDRVSNPTMPGGVFLLGNFYAGKGVSDDFGVYKGKGFFNIQAPAGEYMLIYVTGLGQFYIVFKIEQSAILTIGLQPDDEVSKATLYTGSVTDTSNAEVMGIVTVYAEPGSRGSGEHIFAVDPSVPGITLIGGIGAEYVPGSRLTLYIPDAGNYVLTYISNFGTFEYPFQTTEDNDEEVFTLQPGEEIQEAYIMKT